VNVVVYGGVHYNNVQQVYEIFYDLVYEQGMARLWTTDDHGAPTLLTDIAGARGVPYTVVRANWLVDGSKARTNQRVTLLDLARPEMVVLFPGGELDEMRGLCHANDIPVWDLHELPFADLGTGLSFSTGLAYAAVTQGGTAGTTSPSSSVSLKLAFD